VLEVVSDHFRPEFINRVDEVVVFHPLGREQIREIADLQLEELRKRLLDQELTMEISDEVMELIADTGYDPVYGARPLKRALQKIIENPLAQKVLAGKYAPGDVVRTTLSGDEVCFD
jgi:ATP-dependent Clp protease ATP-binding subunit ClpB